MPVWFTSSDILKTCQIDYMLSTEDSRMVIFVTSLIFSLKGYELICHIGVLSTEDSIYLKYLVPVWLYLNSSLTDLRLVKLAACYHATCNEDTCSIMGVFVISLIYHIGVLSTEDNRLWQNCNTLFIYCEYILGMNLLIR